MGCVGRGSITPIGPLITCGGRIGACGGGGSLFRGGGGGIFGVGAAFTRPTVNVRVRKTARISSSDITPSLLLKDVTIDNH